MEASLPGTEKVEAGGVSLVNNPAKQVSEM